MMKSPNEQEPSQNLTDLFNEDLHKKASQIKTYLKQLLQNPWEDALATKLLVRTKRMQNLTKALDNTQNLCQSLTTFSETLEQVAHKAHETPPNFNELSRLSKLFDETLKLIENPEAAITEKTTDTPSPATTKLLIGMRDLKLAKDIAEHLNYFGYDSYLTADFEEFIKIIQKPNQQTKIAAIILDISLCSTQDPQTLKKYLQQVPLVFVSDPANIHTQLFAVRAGGNAFFTLPLEFSSLIETIDHLVSPIQKENPPRILIVEDSRTQANFTKIILEKAGMFPYIITDPLKINHALKEFQPDLILMDLYMPECTGSELAHLIRQQESYVSLPIVFLSAEEDIIKQLDAMRLGGDDFLTKPIQPEHLVSAVTTRIKRSKALRKEMIQDSLTGLLNHTRILEQLELELHRAQRNKTALSFVMMDIDHFKKINDAYGHLVGDRVIKKLARFFKQRLRKTDSIGRYGGEEFALIFPQSDPINVAKILNEIREKFSQLIHQGSNLKQDFSVTFSAGIASFDEQHDTVDRLVETADKALYVAKQKGRNQVVIADEAIG